MDPLTKVGKMTVKEIRKRLEIWQASNKKILKMIEIQNLTLSVMVEHGD